LRDVSLESAYVIAAMDEHPEYARIRRRESIAAWLVALILTGVVSYPLFYFLSNWMHTGTEHILTAIILICLGPLFAMFFASRMPWHKHYREHVLPQLGASRGSVVSHEAERVELELSAKGVRWMTSEQAIEFPWKRFEDVRLFNSHPIFKEEHVAIVQAGDITAITVPAASFFDDAAMQAFVQSARTLLNDSGYSLSARVRFVAPVHSQLACPQCRYALGNLTSERCPECSHLLTGFSLECARWLSLPTVRWMRWVFFGR
jgi:hypothetical protein